MPCQRPLAAAIATALLLVRSSAFAGGYDELPDQGAQALGRGATFSAKADDATALYYNVAGLAEQRGTKLQISGNLQLDSFSFARVGRYPDSPSDPSTPWGGKPFPVAEDKNASFLLPMMVATTDLGIFERLTFGVGVWGPSANGKTFPIGINGQPSPSRYDYVQSNGTVIFPTLGAGYRLTDTIDIGVAGHVVLANLDELSITYVDPGGGTCKNAESYACDTQGTLKAKGATVAASVGILARPFPSLQLGAQVKTPWSLSATGSAQGKLGSGTQLPSEPASVAVQFPWIVRAGARYVGHRAVTEAGRTTAKPFELYDLELDATYESWSMAGNPGPTAMTVDPTTNKPTSVPIIHNYQDTVSIRVGGAYNIDLGEAVLALRAGTFYDSPTTVSAYTRVDVDTLAKVAGTLGAGYKRGAFAVNLAYASVLSIGRDVADGDIRPSNSAKNGQPIDGEGKLLPAVNNGSYRGFTHVVSLGVEVSFDAFFRSAPSKAEPPPAEAPPEPVAAAPAVETPPPAAVQATAVTPTPPAEDPDAAPVPPTTKKRHRTLKPSRPRAGPRPT